MDGLVFLGDRQVALEQFDDPAPQAGEVVIEVRASGMCGTDLHRYRAPRPTATPPPPRLIAGHEPAGVVAAVGEGVSPLLAKPGDRVMVHHYYACANCGRCRAGWPQSCANVTPTVYGGTTHGSHARYLTVPAATALPLPDELSFAAGAALACGTGTAWSGLLRLELTGRDTIAVFGQGAVGISATMLAAAQGARVIALDISAERLARAREFGAAETVNPAEVDAVEAIRDLTGSGATAALETSGSTAAAGQALRCLDVWGRACFVGIGARVAFDVQPFLRKQVTITTSWAMSSVGQRECADFVIARGLDLDPLFTHRWTLADAAEAYAEFDRQAAGKGVFEF
jgi:2-desacetyl-2-hydroxyethyl bacteriochlorophyllide A dehydrogenase